jgi:RNA polymerase sigma-70 factor (ECF subfamily)
VPALVRASQAGDRAALDELLRRYVPGVRAFLRLRMGPSLRAHESAADVVQSVCVDLLSAHGLAFPDEAAFRNWLFVAAMNKLRNHDRALHSQKRDPARVEHLASNDADDLAACYARVLSPSGELMARERLLRLESAFDRLPEHYREVVALARIAGLTYEQVASATGRSADAVRNILARALNKLAVLLDDADN